MLFSKNKKSQCALNHIFPRPGCFGWWKYHGPILKENISVSALWLPRQTTRVGSPVCSSCSLALADAASRQAQTWILLSTTWAKREQEVKTYDLFPLPGLLKAESGCLSSNYMLGFGFFHFSRSSVHAGIQHKCILREYRLCTTLYIQWGIALILKKSLVNFQP